MLWFSIIDNAAGAAKYFTPDGRDYHVEDERTYAFFGGKAADRLGLGAFDLGQFKRMLHGLHPTDGGKLTVGAKKSTNRAGYEVIFDGPKDLSVLWGFGDTRIPGVFERAMRDTLAYMEQDAKTRVRAKGENTDRTTGNFAYAAVLHTTSREENGKVDGHLHYHVLIPNATFDPVEKRWKALQLQEWDKNGDKLDRPRYLAFYHSRLAHYTQQLGYEVEPTKDAFRVVGLDAEVRDEFCQRTRKVKEKQAEIEAKLREERGNPTYTLSRQQKAKLAAIYREPKQPGRSMESLADHWESRVSSEQLVGVRDLIQRADSPLVGADRSAEAVRYAFDHLTERKSVTDQRAVIAEALRFDPTGVTLEGVMRELARPGIIRRIEPDGRVLVTTDRVRREEESIIRFAVKGRGKCRPLGRTGAAVPATLVPGEHKPPSPSQSAAIAHLWNSPDRLVVWEGKAGVGKTQALQAALAQVDVPWGAFATQAGPSRGALRESGIADADTLRQLLTQPELQEPLRGGLIIIDEISQTGTAEFAQVCQLADELNARILVIGDPSQHKSVPRGDLFALFGKAGLPRASITDIQRQRDEYKQVAELLGRGEMPLALAKLDRMGWVKESGVVDDYLATLAAGKSALIIVPTHAEGEQLTKHIRQRLTTAEKLTDEQEVRRLRPLNLTAAELARAKKAPPESGVLLTRYAAYREETQKLAVGDLLRTTASVRDMAGRQIDSGSRLELVDWTDAGNLRVKTATDQERVLPRDVGHVASGYVSTSQAAQGKTVDHVMVWMPTATFPAVKMDTAYTAGTRGREKLTVYTDDRKGLLDAVQRDDTRVLATDLVRRPRKGLRERMKRHCRFITAIATRAVDRARALTPEREVEQVVER